MKMILANSSTWKSN